VPGPISTRAITAMVALDPPGAKTPRLVVRAASRCVTSGAGRFSHE